MVGWLARAQMRGCHQKEGGRLRAKLSTTEQTDYRAWAQTHGLGVSQSLNLLRWKLYRKAKNERRFRFYTLYDRI